MAGIKETVFSGFSFLHWQNKEQISYKIKINWRDRALNNQTKINHTIIESLLFLVNDLKKENHDIDQQNEKYPLQSQECLHNTDKAQAAVYLKAFADEMPGGFFIYRADETEEIIYANKAMVRMFQCDSIEEFRDLTGNSFRGIVHPEDLEAVEQSIKEQIAQSHYDLDYVEYRIIQKGGDVRWIEDYGHFIHTETAGDVFYVFAGDATDKKQLRLKEKENFHQKLEIIQQEHLRRLEMIEGLSIDYESIFYVNLDANRIKAYRVSERFQKKFPKMHQLCQFTGFDYEYIKTWVHPDDRAMLLGVTTPEYIRRKLSRKQSFHINYRILRDGKSAYIQLRVVNVSSSRRISQVVLGYRNIDEEIIEEVKQKQLLADALDKANLANKAKNLFLSNMSHDIRTPMNAIVGFTELAQKHIHEKEKIADYLDLIASSSEQLLQLLNAILELSMLESGNVNVKENEYSLMEIAHKIQMDMLPRAAQKNISLSLDISNLKHDVVYIDSQKIAQILFYLVDNAVKYTLPNGQISIMIAEKEKQHKDFTVYQFEVQDTGIGISQEFISHIFEPFERERNTTLSGIHGLGLSLTITKNLVEMIGGTIDVYSVVGRGTRFTITLPLRIQEHKKEKFADMENVYMQFSEAKKILIVDDNEINLMLENEVLKDAGFQVDIATDGSIAVEKVKKSQPGDYDLILMDIQMPIMNGYHATQAIRRIENPALAGIPIIAVSANTSEEDKKIAMESGMNAHLAKPLDTPRLFKLIWKFLKDR